VPAVGMPIVEDGAVWPWCSHDEANDIQSVLGLGFRVVRRSTTHRGQHTMCELLVAPQTKPCG
jgi:hypothetical protein